jgi:hypothetical protein
LGTLAARGMMVNGHFIMFEILLIQNCFVALLHLFFQIRGNIHHPIKLDGIIIIESFPLLAFSFSLHFTLLFFILKHIMDIPAKAQEIFVMTSSQILDIYERYIMPQLTGDKKKSTYIGSAITATLLCSLYRDLFASC